MPQKDQLAPLILALTPAERKFFVKYSQLRSDDKSYMKLYSEVLKAKEFNLTALSVKLGKPKAVITHEKEYLTQAILKALRNYNNDAPLVKLNNQIQEVDILIGKGLFELAERINNKTIKQAQSESRLAELWTAGKNQDVISYNTSPSLTAFLKQRTHIAERLEFLSHRFNQFSNLYRLKVEIEEWYAQRTVNRSAQENRQTTEALNNGLIQHTFKDPYLEKIRLELLAKLYQMERNKQKSFEMSALLLALVEKYPQQTQATSNDYFLCIHAYVTDFIAVTRATDYKGYEKFMKTLPARYRRLPFDTDFLRQKVEAYSYVYRLTFLKRMVWNNTIPYKQFVELVKNFEGNTANIRKYMSENMWYNCADRIAGIFFIAEDYTQSIKWGHKLLNRGSSFKLELYIAKVGMLLNHAQLKNYNLLPHLMRSTQRFLVKAGYWGVVEKLTFQLLRSLPVLTTPTQHRHAFETYLAALQKIKAGNSADKISLNFASYEEWALINLQRKR